MTEESVDNIMDVSVLGRKLGTATGWDAITEWSLVFYSFIADEGIDLPNGDLIVDYEGGNMFTTDADGTPLITRDIVTTLAPLPRHVPPAETQEPV